MSSEEAGKVSSLAAGIERVELLLSQTRAENMSPVEKNVNRVMVSLSEILSYMENGFVRSHRIILL